MGGLWSSISQVEPAVSVLSANFWSAQREIYEHGGCIGGRFDTAQFVSIAKL